jgi:hypothetical protein
MNYTQYIQTSLGVKQNLARPLLRSLFIKAGMQADSTDLTRPQSEAAHGPVRLSQPSARPPPSTTTTRWRLTTSQRPKSASPQAHLARGRHAAARPPSPHSILRPPPPRLAPARGRVRLPSRAHARTLVRARLPSAGAFESEIESASTSGGASSSVLSFLCPLLKLLGVTNDAFLRRLTSGLPKLQRNIKDC